MNFFCYYQQIFIARDVYKIYT